MRDVAAPWPGGTAAAAEAFSPLKRKKGAKVRPKFKDPTPE